MPGSRMQSACRELVNPAVQAQAMAKLKTVPENILEEQIESNRRRRLTEHPKNKTLCYREMHTISCYKVHEKAW
jgi:hypothetical protein